VGLSADSPADNRAWAAELKLPFRLLSDLGPKGNVSKAYRVWDDLWGLSKRATFIIDRQGTIRYVDAGGLAIDTKRVLEALQRLPRASQ
jgi:peroxiredoxin (alkyl hydroperoxide reductase subunit C)